MTVELPAYLELVGVGLALGGLASIMPTPVGAPVAILLGVGCVALGRWL